MCGFVDSECGCHLACGDGGQPVCLLAVGAGEFDDGCANHCGLQQWCCRQMSALRFEHLADAGHAKGFAVGVVGDDGTEEAVLRELLAQCLVIAV